MKQLISCAFVLLVFSVLVQSCKKQNALTQDSQTIEVTLKANEDYSFDLGGYGDEEGVSISRQAMHYQTSAVVRDSVYVNITYHYQPAPDYTGTDEVELKSEKGSDGASANNSIVSTTIKFTIIN